MINKKQFNLPPIKGISPEQIEVHIKLYEGYVAQVNKIYEEIEKLKKENRDALSIVDIRRRLGFEISGMKHHELYFGVLLGGVQKIQEGNLQNAINRSFGTFSKFIDEIKQIAKTTRGIGWIVASYDKELEQIHLVWVADHEIGNLTLPSILVVDMWEHAYMVDYKPSQKLDYVSAYLEAINWSVVENSFNSIT